MLTAIHQPPWVTFNQVEGGEVRVMAGSVVIIAELGEATRIFVSPGAQLEPLEFDIVDTPAEVALKLEDARVKFEKRLRGEVSAAASPHLC